MKDKKQLYESIMNSVAKEVKKVLNEGAGSAYDVTIDGLTATNIVVTGKEYSGKYNADLIKFTAELQESKVEWKAEGYYDGVTSDGIKYDGMLVEEIDDEQKTVNGGYIEGYVYKDDVEDFAGDNITEADIISYIESNLSDFKFKTQYGGGYVHDDLDDPMEFENIEILDRWGTQTIFINKIIIEATEMTNIINWYFENSYNFDEIYGLDDEDEE